MRKFLAGPIVETPLIVLQYYKKPSFSIYIYIHIYKEGSLFIIFINNLFININLQIYFTNLIAKTY